jgi:hypothetical protein
MGIPCLVERWSQHDFDVLEDGIIVGRIFCLDAVGSHGHLDVGERPQRRDTPRCAWIRADAGSGHGCVRKELAARVRPSGNLVGHWGQATAFIRLSHRLVTPPS